MKKVKYVAFILFVFAVVMNNVMAKDDEKKPDIQVIHGPKSVPIGDIATIDVPKEYIFADAANTRKIMKLYGNKVTDRELGFLAPSNGKWYVVFEFDSIGYVKDDEKDDLDKDAIFESLKEGNKQANIWRKENNLPELVIKKWYVEPKYDEQTNNLEWGTLATSEGHDVINYNIRYLGRKGVMEVVLVDGTKTFKEDLKITKQLMQKYSFAQGNKYSEYVEGDKIAKYGLAALVTGGAIAVAAKSGLLGVLKKVWKFIIVGLLAVAGALKNFVKRLFGKEEKFSSQKKYDPRDNDKA